MFNEQTLREEIAKTWGEHGAHMDVYDELLKRHAVGMECPACGKQGQIARGPRLVRFGKYEVEIDDAYWACACGEEWYDGWQALRRSELTYKAIVKQLEARLEVTDAMVDAAAKELDITWGYYDPQGECARKQARAALTAALNLHTRS